MKNLVSVGYLASSVGLFSKSLRIVVRMSTRAPPGYNSNKVLIRYQNTEYIYGN